MAIGSATGHPLVEAALALEPRVRACADQIERDGRLPDGLRYLDERALASLFVLPLDVGPVDVKVNRLDNQHLVRYYESERRGE